MAKTEIPIPPYQAVNLLNDLKHPWAIVGGKFFNDYASLILEIDGESTEHRLILRRNGQWELNAKVELE